MKGSAAKGVRSQAAGVGGDTVVVGGGGAMQMKGFAAMSQAAGEVETGRVVGPTTGTKITSVIYFSFYKFTTNHRLHIAI